MKWKYNLEELQDVCKGKVAIVTGANSGIGLQTTKELAKAGCDIIMACRDLEKASIARDEVSDLYPDVFIEVVELDLSSLSSVKNAADQIKTKLDRVDYLINNGGIFHAPKLQSKDGYELHFAVNHLGHFYLTKLLLPLINNSDSGRIITVTSIGYKVGGIHFDDINLNNYSRTKGYGQSKLANLMFAYELQRRLDQNPNNKIKSIAVHPGIVKTNIYKSAPSLTKHNLWNLFYHPFYFFFAQSLFQGTLPVIRAIVDSKLQGGEFLGAKSWFGIRGRPAILKSNKKSLNKDVAKKLWNISEEMTNNENPVSINA